MIILGLSDVAGAHHNSSVALVRDNHILFAASEERFTRIKYDMNFPRNALDASLEHAHLKLDDIDYFAVGYPPSSFYNDLFERNIWDGIRSFGGLVGPGALIMFKYLVPNFKKMYKPAAFQNGLLELGVPQEKIIFMDHHASHAASAYRCSGFDQCLSLSMDGFGPNRQGKNIAGQVYRCENGHMDLLEEIPLYATALWFSAVTVCLGLHYMDGEGKTMGLAAYGDPKICQADLEEMVFEYQEQKWRGYDYWIDYVMTPREDVLVKTRSGRKINRLIQKHGKAHVAAAAQSLLEKRLLGYIRVLKEKYPFQKLALAGGTFLNVKVNKLIRELDGIDHVFIHPHASDGGTAIGAALELAHQKNGSSVILEMNDANLGVQFSDDEIKTELDTFANDIEWQFLGDDISEYVGTALTQGKVIGWFQGREEWGPRALGRRSVLADPRKPETRDMINSQMKNRDWFMPFAPSCMEDKGHMYFKNFCPTPFMTMAFDVVEGKEQDIPSAIHVDNTARVHSVRPDNPRYYRVIETFFRKTGVPVILNTSFNRHGLPIVHRPKEALEHLLWGCVHELAIGGYVVRRKKKEG
jgi:carbamoyltransferase